MATVSPLSTQSLLDDVANAHPAQTKLCHTRRLLLDAWKEEIPRLVTTLAVAELSDRTLTEAETYQRGQLRTKAMRYLSELFPTQDTQQVFDMLLHQRKEEINAIRAEGKDVPPLNDHAFSRD